MWIGTSDGLNRYDGVNVTVFEAKDGGDFSLLNGFVFDLLDPIDAAKFKDKTVISAIKGVIPHTKQIIADYLINVKGVKTKWKKINMKKKATHCISIRFS